MEYDQLPQFLLMLVALGMLIGIGILVFDNFGDAAKESTSVTSESVVITKYNTTISLQHGNLTSFTYLKNASGTVFPAVNVTVDLTAGTIKLANVSTSTLNQTIGQGNTSYATYVYDKYDTATRSTMNSMNASVSPIASTWLPLIVTVAVLSIVLFFVLKSFRQR